MYIKKSGKCDIEIVQEKSERRKSQFIASSVWVRAFLRFSKSEDKMHITAVLRIRIRIRIRIHVFLGLLDPLGMDPDPDPDLDPSNIKQKY